MSKTTFASTRNVRTGTNTNVSEGVTSHHLITYGKGENRSRNASTSNHRQGQGHPIEDSNKGRRVSIRNSCEKKTKSVKTDSSSDSKAYRSIQGERSEKRGDSVAGASSEVKSAKQKVPLEDYYAKLGLDYRLIRKNCKIRINGEGSATHTEVGVYYDSYQLPEGYTPDDLPDSQGLLNQDKEDPISPAVMIAANQKKERTKLLSLAPEKDSSDEIIRRIQMGRRCRRESDPARGSISKTGDEVKVIEPVNNANDTFPDDSLNDADLIMASQQVEKELENWNSNSKDSFKRDINGNSKTSSPCVPLTSTPVSSLLAKHTNSAKETPKTARGVPRSRNRSNAQTNHEMFENSAFDSNAANGQTIFDEDDAPRKLLKFDESPIKNVIFQVQCDKNRSGDFYDDDDDLLLSQMDMPGERRDPKTCVLESSSESANSRVATQLIRESSRSNDDTDCDDEIDSYLDEDALAEIVKLEEIHCTSSGSSTGKSTVEQTYRRSTRSSESKIALNESDASRSRGYRQRF